MVRLGKRLGFQKIGLGHGWSWEIGGVEMWHHSITLESQSGSKTVIDNQDQGLQHTRSLYETLSLAQHCLSSIGQSDQISSKQNKVKTQAGWREFDWSKVAKASLCWALRRSEFGELEVEFQILATAVAWDCYWLSMRDGL